MQASSRIFVGILTAIALLIGWNLVDKNIIQPATAAVARVDSCLAASPSLQSSAYGPCR